LFAAEAATALRVIFGHPVRAWILRVDAGNGNTHAIRRPRSGMPAV
jgi:hypothetical protein